MKVSMTSKSKSIITLNEAPAARKIILDLKENPTTVEEYAKIGASVLTEHWHDGFGVEILKAKAEISKNRSVWDYYHDKSENLDVWIEATARSANAFYEFGIYLSDVWRVGQDESHILENMFVRRFTENNQQ